jgi:deazaflavin-dependent oxidoreductase (nitroreductase family)
VAVSFADSVTHAVLRVHQQLYVRSGGRVGHRTLGPPSLLLHSTGRRSRSPRTNALIYAQDGDDYIVVASNGGADRPPGWLFNVTAKPEVEVQVGTQRRRARARVLERSDTEFDRLWKLANANNRDRYDGYQKRTQRAIPIVVLTPA